MQSARGAVLGQGRAGRAGWCVFRQEGDTSGVSRKTVVSEPWRRGSQASLLRLMLSFNVPTVGTTWPRQRARVSFAICSPPATLTVDAAVSSHFRVGFILSVLRALTVSDWASGGFPEWKQMKF